MHLKKVHLNQQNDCINESLERTLWAVLSGKSRRTETSVSVLYTDALAAVNARIWLALVHICNKHTMNMTHSRHTGAVSGETVYTARSHSPAYHISNISNATSWTILSARATTLLKQRENCSCNCSTRIALDMLLGHVDTSDGDTVTATYIKQGDELYRHRRLGWVVPRPTTVHRDLVQGWRVGRTAS